MVNDRVSPLRLVDFLNADAARAAAAASTLLAAPVHQWRELLHAHPAWRALRTFRDLLDNAHDQLDDDPRAAYRVTQFVLRELRDYHAPEHAALLERQVRGVAWKEHGSALRACGKPKRALRAATRAVAILGENDALVVEHAAARVLQAHLWHEAHQTPDAITTLIECAAIFSTHHESHRYLQVVELLAIILYHTGDFQQAREFLLRARESATLLGDERELARIFNNLGHTEFALGRAAEAWTHFCTAAAAFSALGMAAEVPRAAWGMARVLRERGGTLLALQGLDGVYRAFRDRGMVLDAATVLLDVAAALLANNAAAEARILCAEMVTLFTRAGYHDQAVRALDYLRTCAQRPQDSLADSINNVRMFIIRLQNDSRATFTIAEH
jgi:tetratricopeptide (TPR) repeat protein